MDDQANMNAIEDTAKPASDGRVKGRNKGKSKPASDGKGKRSLNVSMPHEDYERFYIHALRLTNGNISELICRLGRDHLRDYHISRTPTAKTGTAG